MKRWHRSMKRKPKVGEDIIIIWKDGEVSIDTMGLDEYGKSYFLDMIIQMIGKQLPLTLNNGLMWTSILKRS